MSVLLDTGVLFAFHHLEDSRHADALALMSRVANKEFGAPFVSDLVVAELFTLIRARTRSAALEEAARRLLPMPNPSLRGLTMVSMGSSIVGRSWEEFERYRDRQISFTDATLIATLKELRIDSLATFDGKLRAIVPTAA